MRYSFPRMPILYITIVLWLFSVGPLAAQEFLEITPVTIVDVTNGSLSYNQTVLIEDNYIIAIGPADKIPVPEGTTVVDGTGKYIIPGLWDMHVHATNKERIESFSRLFLANGITGFRDMYGSLEVAEETKESVESGDLTGPSRIIVAGNLIDGPPRSSVPGALIASSPTEGRNLVDSLDAVGVPFIKVYHGLPPETYFAISEQTRKRGLPLVGHVPFLVRATEASAAGHRSIEHLTGVMKGCSEDEEAVLKEWKKVLELARSGNMRAVVQQYMVPVRLALATQDNEVCRNLLKTFIDNETWQVPTLVSLRGKAYLREFAAKEEPRTSYFTPPARWTGGRPFGFPMSEEQWELIQSQYEREKEIVGMMAKLGVPLLAGSDTATPWAFPGFGLHDELKLLVEAGLTPLQALQAATINPAKFFGRTYELGSVTEGKLADLVLLDANPLKDISNTQQINTVVSNGRLYRRTMLDKLLNEVKESVAQSKSKNK